MLIDRHAVTNEVREAWRRAISNRCMSLADKLPKLQSTDPLKAKRFEALLRESREWLAAL